MKRYDVVYHKIHIDGSYSLNHMESETGSYYVVSEVDAEIARLKAEIARKDKIILEIMNIKGVIPQEPLKFCASCHRKLRGPNLYQQGYDKGSDDCWNALKCKDEELEDEKEHTNQLTVAYNNVVAELYDAKAEIERKNAEIDLIEFVKFAENWFDEWQPKLEGVPRDVGILVIAFAADLHKKLDTTLAHAEVEG